MRHDGECEDCGCREPDDEDGHPVRDAGDEGIAAAEPHEVAIGRANPRDGVVLPTVGDELGRAAQQLDQLRCQLPACGGLATTGEPAETPREHRDRDARKAEPDRERDRSRR